MAKKPLTISLVIPVYNEESHLAAALQSALAQRIPFDEIIVVDNNSTDYTLAVVSRFPEVTLLHEARQGVVAARTTGFNAARSDIIARIDGDTILPLDWTEQLLAVFYDSAVAAVSGKMLYHDLAATRLVNAIDLYFRRYFARVLGDEVALQGANMAIRRRAWRAVRHDVCRHSGIHEDCDLAIHTNRQQFQVRFDERLVASIGYRRGDSGFLPFCVYALACPITYRQHGLKSGRKMYPVAALAILSYLVLKLLHRGYDADAGHFSLKRLLVAPGVMRVNPVTFVE